MSYQQGNLYFYHSVDNTVTKYTTTITYDEFCNLETDDNSFWVNPRGDNLSCLYTNNEEMMCLRSDKQTEEQAVILFATMLGLRETAAEELAD